MRHLPTTSSSRSASHCKVLSRYLQILSFGPIGRYGTSTHIGSPDRLVRCANARYPILRVLISPLLERKKCSRNFERDGATKTSKVRAWRHECTECSSLTTHDCYSHSWTNFMSNILIEKATESNPTGRIMRLRCPRHDEWLTERNYSLPISCIGGRPSGKFNESCPPSNACPTGQLHPFSPAH